MTRVPCCRKHNRWHTSVLYLLSLHLLLHFYLSLPVLANTSVSHQQMKFHAFLFGGPSGNLAGMSGAPGGVLNAGRLPWKLPGATVPTWALADGK